MKRFRHYTGVVLFALMLPAMLRAQNYWLQKATLMDTGRVEVAAFTIGTKAYIITGCYVSNYSKQLWEYNTLTDTWTRRANFPGAARGFASGFSIGNKGYVCGGSSSGVGIGYNDLWEYDPFIDVWTPKASFPGPVRDMAIAFSIGNKGYYGTGRAISSSTPYNDFWEYDPFMDVWTAKPAVPGPGRGTAVAFVINNKAYVGYGWSAGNVSQTDFYEYDPSMNAWSLKLSGGFSSQSTAVFAVGNKGYVVTGAINGNICSNQLWAYDLSSNSWSQDVTLPAAGRCGAIGFSIGNSGFLGFGDTGNWSLPNDLYEYVTRPLTVEEISGSGVSVASNSSAGEISISCKDTESPLIVSVYNLLGECTFKEKVEQQETKLDVSFLPQGVYILQTETGSNKYSTKFLRQ